jgi:hypothetical protein
MIQTTYVDPTTICDLLEEVAVPSDEELRAASKLADFGVTIAVSEQEAAFVRATIPAHLLYSSKRLLNHHFFFHAKLDQLPATDLTSVPSFPSKTHGQRWIRSYVFWKHVKSQGWERDFVRRYLKSRFYKAAPLYLTDLEFKQAWLHFETPAGSVN